MLSNYLKTTLRTLLRHKGYSFLNICGLAVGLACCLMIVMYVQDERSYDRFHEKADRIYRVTSNYTSEAGTRSFARTMPAVAPALRSDIAEIESTVRFQRYRVPIRYGETQLQENNVIFSDASVFDIFTFPLLQGNPETALVGPYRVVVSEAAAKRHFGIEDPMGKTLVMGDTLSLMVTGVARNVPVQSHFTFDFLISFDTWEALSGDKSSVWTSGTYYTYVLLGEEAEIEAVQSKMPEFVTSYLGEDAAFMPVFQALPDIHLHSDLDHEFQANGNGTYVNIFSLIALFILLIACINFMNLTTARSTQRAREVGVRKAAGALRSQLIFQFLAEAVLMSLSALLIAVVLVVQCLPLFNALAEKTFTWQVVMQPMYIGTALLIALIVGLLAGSYPAFHLSGYRPSQVLKGTLGTHASGGTFRRGLVVFQFAVSMILIFGTVTAFHQLNFMQGRPLGFDKEQVVVVPFYWDRVVQERYETFKTELLGHPAVRHVTASGDVPGRIFTSMTVRAEGMAETDRMGMNALMVDPDFMETYQMELVSGRDFSPELAADLRETFLLNETAARALGWRPEEAVGKQVTMMTTGPVIGVVRDFHYESMQKRVEPMIMTVWPDWFGYISIQIDTERVNETLTVIQNIWGEVIPNRPFESFFLDDDFDRLYRAEVQFGQVFGTFAFLAIFIACLGLLGLALFSTERRTKEIGIRKVMGASVSRIVWLLTGQFARPVLVAALIAGPAAYWVMSLWLEGFAYHTEISGWIFLVSGLSALLVAWCTIGYLSIKAALANPVEALRYE